MQFFKGVFAVIMQFFKGVFAVIMQFFKGVFAAVPYTTSNFQLTFIFYKK
jgi:hypothetical protein